MVAANLIVGAPVFRPHVDVLVALPVRADAKGNTDETAVFRESIGSAAPGDIDLDDAVPEADAVHNGDAALALVVRFEEPHRVPVLMTRLHRHDTFE
jgi:hypothetical protein